MLPKAVEDFRVTELGDPFDLNRKGLACNSWREMSAIWGIKGLKFPQYMWTNDVAFVNVEVFNAAKRLLL